MSALASSVLVAQMGTWCLCVTSQLRYALIFKLGKVAEMTSPFERAVIGGQGWQDQGLTLREAVNVGELMIEPEAAGRAAQICRDLRDKLDGHAETARRLHQKVDFGQCLEGWALSEKFSRKAMGTPTSAYELIIRAQEILDNMAEMFEAAGRAYLEQERCITARFTSQ